MNMRDMSVDASGAALELEDEGGLNLRDSVRVLFKFRWAIIGLAALAGVLASLYAYTLNPIYSATATLLIERDPAKVVPITEMIAGSGVNFEYYNTQFEIIRSRPVAERMVRDLKLDENLVAPPAPARPWWQRWLPAEWFDAPTPPTVAQMREGLVSGVLGGMQVQPIRSSQLARISYTDGDPKRAADLANAAANAYIFETLEGRLEMVELGSKWLGKRLSELRAKVDESERALQDFKERENIVDVKTSQSLEIQQVSVASSQLNEARADRIRLQLVFDQVKTALNSPNPRLDSIPGIMNYPLLGSAVQAQIDAEKTLAELSQRYGPQHPDIVTARTRVQTTTANTRSQFNSVIASIGNELEAARRKEATIAGELGSAKADVQDKNRKDAQLQTLKREAESNRQLYELFQNRFKETDAAGGQTQANARIVERAVPNFTPIAPNKRRIVMLAVILALGAGIALAFALEHLDSTLKGAEDVERKLSLPVLGMLPKLKSGGRADTSLMKYFVSNPNSGFAEAIRTIRTGVLLSSLDQPHRVILVSSSVPGEGKSTLSANLALALGQIKKVLLIDADMRRPAVARAMDSLKGRAGLSQFITGDAKISECVTQIEGSNLFVMGAGVIPPNPLEMLSSKRFSDSLDNLKKAFDHIVIDCPPSLAVSDALVLAKLSDAVLYVVKADSTPHQLAQHGVKRFRRVGAPLLGVVVNRVAPRAQQGYGKYGYYGDSYYAGAGYGYYTRD
jgi:polysaccharide biosynthesis transport protein